MYAIVYPGAFILDFPRAMPKRNLEELYAGVESIKNGMGYDKRYSLRKIRFDRPAIIVFTNRMPVFSLLSKDRWEIHEMQPDFTLKHLTIAQAKAVQKNHDKVAKAMAAAEDAEDEEQLVFL